MSTTSKRDSMDATTTPIDSKLSSTQPPPAKMYPKTLNDLPPSVRKTIYKYVLDTELVNTGLDNVSYSHTLKDGVLNFSASRPPFPVQTSLFYVNKHISAEALQYFYSSNLFIRFEIYTPDARHAKSMLEDSGVLFSTAAPEMLERSKQHALDIVLVEKNSGQKRAVVMFPAQYLPRLINFFDQASRASAAWAPRHAIFVDVLNVYDYPVSRVQGDLLELFRLLNNLGGGTVASKHLLPRYAEGLQSSMTAPRFSAEQWLKSVTELADLADEAREKEDYLLAYEYGQAVVIALTYGYLTHAEALHSQEKEFSKSVQRLRWRTELGIGISLSLQHRSTSSVKDWLSTSTDENKLVAQNLLLAESSLSKALSLATDSPSPNSNPWFLSLPVELIPPNQQTWFTDLEKAQTWFGLGTVHAALTENLFAAGDFERALELWKDGEGREKVESAFDRVRQAIDGDAMDMFVGRVRPGTGLTKASRLAKRRVA